MQALLAQQPRTQELSIILIQEYLAILNSISERPFLWSDQQSH